MLSEGKRTKKLDKDEAIKIISKRRRSKGFRVLVFSVIELPVREERHMALGSPVPVRSSRMGSDPPERLHTAGRKDKSGLMKGEDRAYDAW